MRSFVETLAKSALPGAAIAALAAWGVHSGRSGASAPNFIDQILGLPIGAGRFLLDLVNHGEAFRTAHDYLLGPGLPATAALASFVLVTPWLLVPVRGRPVIDWLWPAAPDVLDPRLERTGVPRQDAFASGTPFVERQDEMRKLMAFAGGTRKGESAHMFLTGREGMGKTRLALEWQKQLRDKGWDVGVLEPGVTAEAIKRAKFRRKTAVLIDEPGRLPDIWKLLDALMATRQRVCVLLADQYGSNRPDALDDKILGRIDRTARPPLRLEGLSDEGLASLAPNVSEATREAAEGRPRYVLHGDDPQSEFARQAQRRVDSAKSDPERAHLLAAALAGPLPREQATALAGSSLPVTSLERLFEGENRRNLKLTLPAVAPEPVADDLVMRLASDLADNDLAAFVEKAVAANAAAVERHLGNLWQRGGLSDEQTETLTLMQDAFDRAAPERVQAMRAEAKRLAGMVSGSPHQDSNGKADFGPMTDLLDRLANLAARRPLDHEVRMQVAEGIANAIHEFGVRFEFADVERWAARLDSVGEEPALRERRELPDLKARSVFCACHHYGDAGRFDDLERWARRFDALADEPDPRSDREIRLREAEAAVNAISGYGDAGRFDDLERWARRFDALADEPDLQSDREIRLREAEAAVNAISGYGKAGRFDDLERWARRFDALAAEPALRSDREIGLEEAKAAFNAISGYGTAGRFDDLERWARRFDALADEPDLRSDREIRLREAEAAFNAISDYGKAGRHDGPEARSWRRRLAAAARDFPGHAGIQEAAAYFGLTHAQFAQGWPYDAPEKRRDDRVVPFHIRLRTAKEPA